MMIYKLPPAVVQEMAFLLWDLNIMPLYPDRRSGEGWRLKCDRCLAVGDEHDTAEEAEKAGLTHRHDDCAIKQMQSFMARHREVFELGTFEATVGETPSGALHKRESSARSAAIHARLHGGDSTQRPDDVDDKRDAAPRAEKGSGQRLGAPAASL